MHPDFARGGVADVDHAAAMKGAAVVDAHHDAVTIGGVGDADQTAEGQGAVRRGQLAGIEAFAAGGAVARQFAAVIARRTAVDFGFVGDIDDRAVVEVVSTNQ